MMMSEQELKDLLLSLQNQLEAGDITQHEYLREESILKQMLRDKTEESPAGSDFFSTGGGLPSSPPQPSGGDFFATGGQTPPAPSVSLNEAVPTGADFFATGGQAAPVSTFTPEYPTLAHRYSLRELVGSGGMGQVWKAWDPLREELVAIKQFHAHMVGEEWSRLFRQEMETLQRLKHPEIVEFRGLERDPLKGFFFVMEWFEGKPLHGILEQTRQQNQPSPFSLSEVKNLLESLVGALQSAHERGVLHLDLKPANILVNDAGQLKLIDFGIARLQGERQQGIQGTAYYMAPEQLRGESGISATADVYALAIVAYQLLTGQLFQGGMPGPSELNTVLPAALDAIHFKAVSWKPEDRFSSVREWWEAFEQALHSTTKPAKTSATRKATEAEPVISKLVVEEAEEPVIVSQLWTQQLDALDKKRPSWIPTPLQRKPPRFLHSRKSSPELLEAWSLKPLAETWWLLSREGKRLLPMQEVVGGKATIGASKRDKRARRQEKPEARVQLSPCLFATLPVTRRVWDVFVKESGYTPPASFQHPDYLGFEEGEEEQPVSHLSVAHIWAFCDFYGLSLPSEAQWEVAMQESQGLWQPAGQEWVADEYDAMYYRKARGENPVMQSQQRSRFVSVRGEEKGCYYRRNGLASDTCREGLGFRVVFDGRP